MLKARIAVIGAGLMGHGIAQVFAVAGHDVTIYDSIAASRDSAKARILANLKDLGDDQSAVERVRPAADLADAVRDADYVVEAIVDTGVKKFGRVDILVVASGQNKVAKIVDQKPEDFLDVMDANVTQSWLIARAAGRQMLKQGQGGKVILMSSARGLLGHPAGYTAYCASKAAVDGIAKALGCEWGETGITVNALGPTVFRSPLTQWMFEDTERARDVRKGFLTRVPKGRLGEPSDLAGPLLFLASQASDFYTGHTLYADGGYTAG